MGGKLIRKDPQGAGEGVQGRTRDVVSKGRGY